MSLGVRTEFSGWSRRSSALVPLSPWSRWVRGLLLALSGALWLALSLALVSHRLSDPGFSSSGTGEPLFNWLGLRGAWWADVLYVLFGFSAWWLVIAAARAWLVQLALLLSGMQPDADGEQASVGRLRRWVGLPLLMCSSCALEWSRMYRWEGQLPGTSGGMLGDSLGAASVHLLGFNGAGVAWISLLVMALPWVMRFSWVAVADGLGAWIDGGRVWVDQRIDIQRDARLGEQAQRERALDAEERTEREVQQMQQPPLEGLPPGPAHTPIVIEPPVLEVPKSKRAIQERQPPLFSELGGKLPRLDLLDTVVGRPESIAVESLEMTSRLIEKKLADFGVQVRVIAAQPGPVVTRYEIEPATGVKGSQIVGLAKDLARSLSLVSIRVVETIPGKNLMALELPNAKRQTIRLTEILGSAVYADAPSQLTLALGKDIVGLPIVADLAKMPHCLVAGTTGSGKSVGINGMILSLLYKSEPKDVRLILIDPKMLEMSVYEGIPHLLCPVVTDMKQASNALNWCVAEMDRRYRLLSKLGVRNLAGYNRKIDDAKNLGEFIGNPLSLTPEDPEPLDRMPQIVIIIDELADLMMVVGKKIEELIARLAQKARAAGVHLILATQRPSVDVITGLIKANIPTRLSFQVSSKIDSRTILDQMGAEALLGMGDMLYMASGTGLPVRVHGAFVSDEEVHRVVDYLKSQGEPDYIEGILEGGTLEGDDAEAGAAGGSSGDAESDPLYDQAVAIVLEHRKVSISLVQRHLRIGYNRAARLVEQMQKSGLVSAMATNGSRELLTPKRDE